MFDEPPVYVLQNRYADIQKPRLRRSKKERPVICANCDKHFYQSEEGFVGPDGKVICADCQSKLKFRTACTH